MFGSLWSVNGGNKQVPEKLLQHSSANVFHRRVTKVTRDQTEVKYHIESISSDPTQQSFLRTSYDIVVIANPITADSRTSIDFLNFTVPIKVPGVYHRTVATFISGTLNGSYFGLPENDAPQLIINNNEEHVINSMGTLESVKSEKSTRYDANENVWKIFSQRPLTEHELNALFQKRKTAKSVDWLAYPHYDKLSLTSKFVLDDGLFYVNAVEWAASAMEMSVIGAKNVALLVQKKLTNSVKTKTRRNHTEKREKSDL
jgi:prenylcysteine oxidase/farnesylcysteine lyase